MGRDDERPGLQHVISTTASIRKVAWAEDQGYEAVIQSIPMTPGVEAARLAVRIPVIGMMRASLHAAAVLAGRIAITVSVESHVAGTWKIVRAYGMEHFVTDIRALDLELSDMEAILA